MKEPATIVTFSDAGAHIRNMAFYNFPLHLLRLVHRRQQAGAPIMSTGQAVHRVTAELADYLGVDAGRLRVGGRADVAIVDPAGLDDHVDDVEEADMPGLPSVRRLVNRNDGAVRAVFVNGRQAWDGTAAAPEFGRAGGFGTVIRRTAR